MIVEHKAKGGLIKLEITIENLKIKDIKITGDFFIYPEDSVFDLEKKLRGKTEKESIKVTEKFLSDVKAPGIELDDFKKAFKKAFEEKNVI
ncbi:MAG: lipoate--protein ligase family protein [Methanomicrobia archaeon]|nr:lipoate--protein ligase family protein [Methanomicrobia archaeon]